MSEEKHSTPSRSELRSFNAMWICLLKIRGDHLLMTLYLDHLTPI